MRIATLLAPLFVLLFAACAADPGSGAFGPPDAGERPPGPDAGPGPDSGGARDTGPEIEEPIPGNPYLEFGSSQYVRMPFSTATDLVVRHLDGNDQPLANVQIDFAYDTVLANGSALRTSTARTDEDGYAAVQLIAGPNLATFDVVARVRNGEGINSLTFNVDIRSKDSSDYIFEILYSGALRLQTAEIFVFKSAGNCASIARNPADVVGSLETLRARAAADSSFDPIGYEVDAADIPLTRIAAFVYDTFDNPVGFACNDGPFFDRDGNTIRPADVELGMDVRVPLEVLTLYPGIRGTYNYEMQVDVIEFLPTNVQNVVRYLGDFFRAPGSTIFTILADAGIFDLSSLPFGIGGTIGSVIDSLIFAVLPPNVVRIFETGADIYGALQSARLQGRMIYYENADDFGGLGECNEVLVDRVLINFATITDAIVRLDDRGYVGAYGTFTGYMSVADSRTGPVYEVNIDPFDLELNWGQILIYTLEDIIFPTLIDPSVRSMEDFVRYFLDCADLAAGIDNTTVRNIVRDSCDAIISAAVAGIVDFIAGQAISTGDFYLLATPAEGTTPPSGIELLEAGMIWSPCDLGINRSTFTVQELGRAGRDRCVWDARLRNGPADPVGRPVPGAFFATRQSDRVTGTCGR